MSLITISNGMIVLIESDKKGEWWAALPWQFNTFTEAMKFGTMKSMGGHYQDTFENTKPFNNNGMKYRYIIQNDWGPCWIENLTTGKKREIKYLEIGNVYKKTASDLDQIKIIPSKIKISK